MTSRAFRKLRKQKETLEQDIDSNEILEESPPKQNPFLFLSSQVIDDEDDDQEDEDSFSASSSNNVKSQKSQEKSRKQKDQDLDVLLKEFEELDSKMTTNSSKNIKLPKEIHLLSIDAKNLDAEVEMKRMFGSAILEQSPKNKRKNKRLAKRNFMFARPKDTWPRMTKLGLGMQIQKQAESDGSSTLFTFTHSKLYSDVQIQFLQAVQSHSPNAIAHLLHMFPYHIDSLLQLSEICKMNGDAEMSTELIERALFAFESALHPMFNLTTGTTRLNFNRVENRGFYLALMRHADILARKGCWRTALETFKTVLTLDIESDPFGILLLIDYYALKSCEYQWLLQFYEKYKDMKRLNYYPNFMYSIALAHWELENEAKKDHLESNKLLLNAMQHYPSALPPLFEKASLSETCLLNNVFEMPNSNSLLDMTIQIFVERHWSLWKMSDTQAWLKYQLNACLDEICSNQKRMQQNLLTDIIPKAIQRHVIVTEIEALKGRVQSMAGTHILSFDPLPPETTERSIYDEFLSRQAAANPLSNAGFFTGLLQSILPWTNAEGLDLHVPLHLQRERIDEALDAAQEAMPHLFPQGSEAEANAWLQSLRDALFGTEEQEESD